MVQLESESSARSLKAKSSVKLEINDFVEEELAPLCKRSRPCVPSDEDLLNRWSWKVSVGGGACNPLEEPSPLGLQLRKSPSFLDLIQMKLSQESAVSSRAICGDPGRRRDGKGGAAAGSADKLKASNFPASILRIGTWECLSRHEGDLVAKCYFAKHKLVWEVLDGSLKSKIEIQWSDITALKASCPENGPGTMDVVMARQPLFFRETNPQPRKHTLWQATSDFTGGQASIHRRHFLQCAPGLLSKHYEKLIRCDRHLYALSQQPEFVLDSPFLEPRCSIFEGQEDACHALDHVKGDYGSDFPGFCDASSTCSAPSSSSKSGLRDPMGRMETPSPISGVNSAIIAEDTDVRIEKLRDPLGWDSLKIPGLHPSMSTTDLINHIGDCFSGKSSTTDQLLSDSSPMNQDMLEQIAHYLFGDIQSSSVSDEKLLMVRVNSLCCLLQNPTSIQNIVQTNNGVVKGSGCTDKKVEESTRQLMPLLELGAAEEVKGERIPSPAISRKDSVGELLVHLPRIASHPCVFFNEVER